MQKGKHLEFECIACQKPVRFSIFDAESNQTDVRCSSCEKEYLFQDPTICRQLQKFEALCRQILDSEEILGNTSIGVNVGGHHVKIPYKILLTRFNACIDLVIGEKPVSIIFRLEPQLDMR